MAITASDLLLRFSVAAAAGNTTGGTAAGSLGDQISTTDLTTATLHNLFGVVTEAESAAGVTKYRCVFLLNNHATLTYQAASIALTSQTSGGSSIALALDNVGVTAKGSSSAQAAVVASETTVPSGVGAFGSGLLTIGDIPAGSVAAFWVRQTTAAGASAVTPDGAVLTASGGTDA